MEIPFNYWISLTSGAINIPTKWEVALTHLLLWRSIRVVLITSVFYQCRFTSLFRSETHEAHSLDPVYLVDVPSFRRGGAGQNTVEACGDDPVAGSQGWRLRPFCR